MEKESTNPEITCELWLNQARDKWKETDLSARQYWLTEVARDLGYPIPSREHHILVMKHKAFDFNQIPDEYQEILAKKWGFIE